MSKTFCVLPWTHFFHNPTGKITPCCAASDQTQYDYGNVKDFATCTDIINQDSFNTLRRNMLDGVETDVCNYCYQAESHGGESFRTSKNSMLDQMISMDEIKQMTNPDGSVNDFKMRYWDVRFSNVCNLACRMCGPDYSHTLAKEMEIKFNGSYVVNAHNTDNFEEMIAKYGPLDKLYDIYFAGGEVMFQKEHWQMLDHLVKIGKTDVMLMYNTNLTKLDYDGFKLLDYIPKFKDVTFTVSLDGTGDLLEYIRWGSRWDDIVRNLDTLKKMPNVNIRIVHVTMHYNVLDLMKTIDFFFSNRYITDAKKMDLQMANEPHNHVGALPKDLKQEAIRRIQSSNWYTLLGDLRPKLDAIIDAMRTTDYEFPKDHIREMDQRRGCNVIDVVPEFGPYMS